MGGAAGPVAGTPHGESRYLWRKWIPTFVRTTGL
jgi:hypothetical protein